MKILVIGNRNKNKKKFHGSSGDLISHQKILFLMRTNSKIRNIIMKKTRISVLVEQKENI